LHGRAGGDGESCADFPVANAHSSGSLRSPSNMSH
jgi:hypothetical protein